MKRTLFLLSLTFCCVPVHAQEKKVAPSMLAMLEGNPIWEYYFSYPSWKTIVSENGEDVDIADPKTTFYYYYIKGDSIYNGMNYKCLYRQILNPDGRLSSALFLCGIREFGGMIIVNKNDIDGEYGTKPDYMLECQFPPYNWTEEVLIDFTLTPGQFLYSNYYWTEKDSVYFRSTSNDIIPLKNGHDAVLHNYEYYSSYKYEKSDGRGLRKRSLQAIEGIGYINKFLPLFDYDPVSASWLFHLNRFWRNGELLYQVPDFVLTPEMEESLIGLTEEERQYMIDWFCMESETFKDNPYLDLFLSTTAVHDVINKAQEHEAIFDLQGRQLLHKPEKGLYIQNGKVRMAK